MRRLTNAITGLAISALFLTSSAAAAAEPFFFIQLSVPQFGMSSDNQDFTQETANFELAVATVNHGRARSQIRARTLLPHTCRQEVTCYVRGRGRNCN